VPTGFEALLGRLADRDLILPYFDAAMMADNWPEKYSIEIDSSPYYGLGDGYFHPSTHALLDERELYLRFHPDTRDKMIWERNSVQRQMTFAMGSALHGVIQTQMAMMKLVKPEDIEVEYINHDHHVRGKIDWIAYLPDGSKVVVEMKTRLSWAFAKQTDLEPSWRAQLNLALDSQDCDLGILLMVESGWPYRMTEFQVKRDHVLLKEIYDKFDRVRAAIAKNEPPRHCCGPNTAKMKACPARGQCWEKEGW
jgi:hypothetical protein